MFKAILGVCFVFCAMAPAWLDDPALSNEEIMKKVNNKKAGLHGKLKDGVKAKTPEWDDVAKKSKDYKSLIDALGKNKPTKGDNDSWAKLTKQYSEQAGKFEAAVEKKDKEAAFKALNAIDQMCAACHKEHRPS